MSVKVLHRRTKLGPTTGISMLPNLDSDPPVKYGAISAFGNLPKITFGHRRSATGDPLTIGEKISEFIALNKPNLNINMNSIRELLSKLKVPGLALLGVAFVGGIAYLAYKLYSNWTNEKASKTVDKIMEDFAATTPDLLNLPGWYDQVKTEVINAVGSGDEANMVEQIAKLKTSIVEKQQSMGAKVGAGIDLFDDLCVLTPRMKKMKIGGGVIMPL